MIRRTIAVAAFCFSVSVASAAEFRTGQPVMGTILDVTVIAANAREARSAAAAAIATVKRWDDILTTWRPEGELAQLNRAAGKGQVRISEELHSALVEMLALADQTGGAFDPGVGPLVDLWRESTSPDSRATLVGEVAIRSVLSLASRSAALTGGAALDAGAIGKGVGLDAAVAVLRAAGIRTAFLDFGGSSQSAIGAPPDSPQGWQVVVTGLSDGDVRGVVSLRDAALSTSRTGAVGAAEGAIIDPRARKPVSTPRVATVRTTSGAAADAWSTALAVLGSDGVTCARSAGVDVFIEDGRSVVEQPDFIEGSK